MRSSAEILIIGDELLHGEITDVNGPWLIGELQGAGVRVRRLKILPDEIDVLVPELQRALDADYVLTTGGIGPTHDDCTRRAVAGALQAPLTDHPGMLNKLRSRHETPLRPSLQRVAVLPENAEVVHLDSYPCMSFRVENVYVFPGVPELLKPLFHRWSGEFEGEELFTESVEVDAYESEIAELLQSFQEQYHQLQFGSYPRVDGTLTVKIRGTEPETLERAHKQLAEELPSKKKT